MSDKNLTAPSAGAIQRSRQIAAALELDNRLAAIRDGGWDPTEYPCPSCGATDAERSRVQAPEHRCRACGCGYVVMAYYA